MLSHEQRLELLKEACFYYKRYFLPALTDEERVIAVGAYL